MPTGQYDHTPQRVNFVGKTIGYAFVRKLHHRDNGRNFWECECLYDGCGKIYVRSQASLMRHKEDANCGCLCKLKSANSQKKRFESDENIRNLPHGLRIYEIYHGMTQRCSNPNYSCYDNYGGRGIRVCDEWLSSRRKFYDWSISNGYADNLTLDRIDVNGNYCPDNCRWADLIVQGNNRRSTVKYQYRGRYYTVAELAREIDIDEGTLSYRLAKGLSVEDACRKINAQTGATIKRYMKRIRQ